MIDRDILVVDLVSLEEAKDVQIPQLAICLIGPFVEKNREYIRYLNGNGKMNLAEKNDYEKMTLNLNDYFLYAMEARKNDPDTYINSSLTIDHVNTFNGFNSRSWFMKCFSLVADLSNHRYIKKINLFYNKTKILQDWKGLWKKKGRFDVKLHDKGQFLIGDEPYFDPENTIGFGSHRHSDQYIFVITELEVIQGRNSRHKKCSSDFSAYDKMMVQKHVFQKGCRAPYLLDDPDAPLCNSSKDIKDAKFSYEKTKAIDLVKPCNRITRVLIDPHSKRLDPRHKIKKHIWKIGVVFPDEVRIIVKSREVDIHTLIGNIGGYLGLLTGYAAVQIPTALFFVFDRFRSYYNNL